MSSGLADEPRTDCPSYGHWDRGGSRPGITNTRNEGDNTLRCVHPPPPLRPNIGPGQNNCNSIVRHDFCFLYTILTAVVRSENIIMPFLAPDRSSHILLEKYGYYTWPITVLDQLLAVRFFMIIPLFYSRLMLKTISAGPDSPPSESGTWLVSARQSLCPAPAAPARTLRVGGKFFWEKKKFCAN